MVLFVYIYISLLPENFETPEARKLPVFCTCKVSYLENTHTNLLEQNSTCTCKLLSLFVRNLLHEQCCTCKFCLHEQHFARASCLYEQNFFERTENGRENIDCNHNTTKNKTPLSFKHPPQFFFEVFST